MPARFLVLEEGEPVPPHTPIDDLQSFAWIILWVVHYILANARHLRKREYDLWVAYEAPLNSRRETYDRRHVLLQQCVNPLKRGSAVWEAWRPLMTALDGFLDGSKAAQLVWDDPSTPASDLDELKKIWYTTLAHIILDFLDNPSFLSSAQWDVQVA